MENLLEPKEYLKADRNFRELNCTQSFCHVGTTIELVPYLRQVIGEMPYHTIHFYTPSLSVSKALQTLNLPDKIVIPHVVEGIYSERWLFELSRQIAERRVSEVIALAPDILRLQHFPEVCFEKLAIRRVSLSRLYYELSVFFALEQQIAVDSNNPLVFLSSFFEQKDVETFHLSPFISVNPQSVREIPTPSRIQWINEYIRKAVVKVLPLFGKNRQKSYQKTVFRKLEQLEILYSEMRERSLFLQLKLIERMIRHQYKKPFKQFRKIQVRCKKIKLFTMMWANKCLIYALSGKYQKKVLIISPSINGRNKNYYLRLFKPVAQHLLDTQKDLIFMLWNHDKKACKSLVQAISQYKKTGLSKSKAHFLPVNNLIELYKEREALFKNDINFLSLPVEVTDAKASLLNNTLGSINSLKYSATLIYFHLTGLEFNMVLGVEEDIEYVSILNLLKPVLGNQYTTFIVPSCLPEYSVCYDCVDVDHLAVALPFVKRIFAEQSTNATHIHVVGSQEWEEPESQTFHFPKNVEKLIDSSHFILGVLHQPIFVTMHGQTIYNNLTVNFLDIYERFLAQHQSACILIKPHPRDNLEQLTAYLPKSSRILVLPKNTPNKLLYQRIDAAISIHSTMVTHALAHGVPVVSLYKYPDYVPLYDFIQETGGLATDSHEEALAWLARMYAEPSFRAEVRQRMSNLREQSLSVPTSQQIVKILETASNAK